MAQHGYKTVFLNERLSVGLAPEGRREYTTQRARWCLGAMQIVRGKDGPFNFSNRLPLAFRLSLIETAIFWSGLFAFRIICQLATPAFLVFGLNIFQASTSDSVSHFVPMLLTQFVTAIWIREGRMLPVNRRWIADFTYIWTAEGWLYVAAVVDLFSRRVVGWSMSTAMTAQLVTDALVMAIWRRGKPDALVHHSDRGSQYSSEQFQRLMADHGVVCSMSRSGNVWDNAAMESFFSSFKTERTAAKTYRSRDEAKADVFDYIERF